jgi:hypothetical protein
MARDRSVFALTPGRSRKLHPRSCFDKGAAHSRKDQSSDHRFLPAQRNADLKRSLAERSSQDREWADCPPSPEAPQIGFGIPPILRRSAPRNYKVKALTTELHKAYFRKSLRITASSWLYGNETSAPTPESDYPQITSITQRGRATTRRTKNLTQRRKGAKVESMQS